MTALPALPEDRLDSWKEIASYLNRGVRTVRRWEREEGLPVHRQQHRILGSVYAYRSEIDAWRKTGERRARPASAAVASGAAPLDAKSIVVLPFANLSDDREQQYFGDGITEDLTTDLSRLAGMFVISRNTAFT
jgi:hypothetical protein